MAWFTVYRTTDGALRVHTSIDPGDPGAEWTVINHGEARQDQTHIWNPATRAWDIPIPVPVLVDRLQDLINHPYAAEIWTRLTAAQRTKMRKLMVWLLAGKRWRGQNEEVSIDPAELWPADPADAVE
jgi:hypothetical protein